MFRQTWTSSDERSKSWIADGRVVVSRITCAVFIVRDMKAGYKKVKDSIQRRKNGVPGFRGDHSCDIWVKWISKSSFFFPFNTTPPHLTVNLNCESVLWEKERHSCYQLYSGPATSNGLSTSSGPTNSSRPVTNSVLAVNSGPAASNQQKVYLMPSI